jgi:putative FmdB family regulatory protein
MPLYEYQCDACGHRFEKIQKFSDPLEDKCPKCGGAVHKLMSSPAIQFKGSGFYITDYAKKDHVAAEKADGPKAEKADQSEKAEKGGKGDSTETKKSETTDKKSDSTEKKSDAAAKTETATPAASASKETKRS